MGIPTDPNTMSQEATFGAPPLPQGGAGLHFNHRILCPVVTCPESSETSRRHFRDFSSIKNHLNDHVTGHLSGAVPVNFLRNYRYSQCSVCDKILHTRYNGICPRCRPAARAQEQLSSLRNPANPPARNLSSTQQPHTSNGQTITIPSLAEIHGKFVPTIRNIPLALRGLWAQCLKQALARAVWNNNEASWVELQMLAKCTLCHLGRAGRSHKSKKLNWTRSRLQRWLDGERAELWSDLPNFSRPHSKQPASDLIKSKQQERCINLTAEGGYSNACKVLVSSPPLNHTEEATNILANKHPTAIRPVNMSAFGNSSSALVPLADTNLIEKCIRSFHRLSGGGPSSLRPIHLQNCLSTEHRDEVLERCTDLTNLLAKGEAPASLAPFLAGANLTALPKKDNGIRPVAVGEVWRRLTAKSLCNAFKEQSASYFFPQQIGVGQSLGTEVGLETARQWQIRNNNNPTAVFVKADFSNAFNCVDRQAFLEQCRHHFPGLSRWAEWCYSQPSQLHFGSSIISSERGVQQGDPLGPLFFSLALQPLLIRLSNGRSEHGLQLAYSYLDDLILAGEQHAVAETFICVKNRASSIGLDFNFSKCEIIPAAGLHSSLNKDLFPEDVVYMPEGNFELLGGPIGSDAFCNSHTQKRVDKAKEILAALGDLPDPQVALTLLRHCASFGKLVFSLRVVPHQKHREALTCFDEAVRDCIETFMCCSFSDT